MIVWLLVSYQAIVVRVHVNSSSIVTVVWGALSFVCTAQSCKMDYYTVQA